MQLGDAPVGFKAPHFTSPSPYDDGDGDDDDSITHDDTRGILDVPGSYTERIAEYDPSSRHPRVEYARGLQSGMS